MCTRRNKKRTPSHFSDLPNILWFIFYSSWNIISNGPAEFEATGRRLIKEIENLEKESIYKDHTNFLSNHWKEIKFLKEYLEITETNPTIKLDELSGLADQRLKTEERATDKSNNVFETDKNLRT
jgi:hypothetical protein